MNMNSISESFSVPPLSISKKISDVWSRISVQWKLHLLIQLSLVMFFVILHSWIVTQFDDMGIKDIETQANETSNGLINGLNLLMVTGQIFDPGNRELLVKKMSSSPFVKELHVARAEQVNKQFGPGLPSEAPRDDLVKQVIASGLPSYVLEDTAEGLHVLRAIIPFVASENFRGTNCLSCHYVRPGSVNGAADIRMDLSVHEQNIVALKQWLWTGMLFFQITLSGLIALFVRVILSRHISQPIQDLQNKIDNIRTRGDLSMRIALDEKHPDVTKIAQSVNSFIDNLEVATKETNLLSMVVENSEEAILITDADKNIVFVNKSFERITGYRLDEVIGKNPRILKSGMQDINHYKNMWHEINSTGSWRGEVFNRRKNGQIFPEWQSINEVRNDHGIVTNYVSIFGSSVK